MRALVAAVAFTYVGLLVGFTAGFADSLPTVAWVGLGLVTTAAIALAIATIVLFERLDARAGTSGNSATHVADGRHRVLVVADVGCDAADACPMILAHMAERASADVFVVAPTITSPFHHLMGDDDRERGSAGGRLDEIIALLKGEGVKPQGIVGSDLPLEAIQDALAIFPADEIIVLAPPEDSGTWSEHQLVERAQRAFRLPVTHIPVNRPNDAQPGAGRVLALPAANGSGH